MRTSTTFGLCCALFIGASASAGAQAMGRPHPAPSSAMADTQHVSASDSTAKTSSGMKPGGQSTKKDEMGKDAMGGSTGGSAHSSDKKRAKAMAPMAKDTGMTKPHRMAKDSSTTTKKSSM
jgi:hypothetical protein